MASNGLTAPPIVGDLPASDPLAGIGSHALVVPPEEAAAVEPPTEDGGEVTASSTKVKTPKRRFIGVRVDKRTSDQFDALLLNVQRELGDPKVSTQVLLEAILVSELERGPQIASEIAYFVKERRSTDD